MNKFYADKVSTFNELVAQAIITIDIAGNKANSDTNKHWKSKLAKFTNETTVNTNTITQEIEKQRDINTDITHTLIE